MPSVNAPEQVEKSPVKTQNLAEEIQRSLKTSKKDCIIARQVYGDNYRVNWFDLENNTILKSRFLKVTKTPDGLLMDERPEQ